MKKVKNSFKQIFGTIIISLFIMGSLSLDAQTDSYSSTYEFELKSNVDWSFATKMGNKQYIDFAKAPFDIKEIVVVSTNNEILFRDQVNDLPIGRFYEVTIPQRSTGFYVLQIRGQKKLISKLYYLGVSP